MAAGEDGAGRDVLAGVGSLDLFEGLEGSVWLAARDGALLAVGGSAWRGFAERNHAGEPDPQAFVGRSMFEVMHGDAVRDTYRHLHQRLLGGRPAFSFEMRCDSPDCARVLRMAMGAVRRNGEVVAVLYQSQVIDETARPSIRLFDGKLLASRASETRPERIVTLCSYCQLVAWPVGAPPESREWIRPERYYGRGGRYDVAVSHGICPGCLDRLMGDELHVA